MSSRLPAVDSRRLLRALERAGFVVLRTRGSHHILQHPDDPRRRVTVPVHRGRDLPTGTLRNILRQAGLSVEALLELL